VTAAAGLAAGARDLVGEVQRFGLFSAVAVVDRYVEMVDRAIARDDVAPAPARDDDGPAWPVDTAVQVARAWLRLLDTTSALLRTDVPREPAAAALVLPTAAPGGISEVSFWIHNTTSSPAPDVALHVTPLMSSNGRALAAESVSLVPQRLDLLAAGTSQEVRLRVLLPAGQPPACYLGMVLTSAAPSEPMVVRLEVAGSGP
jgi:hypothetical protein